jgi:hypothetical protein
MSVDPAPFLSTVILASAALVAIVGGLLVGRFLSLDSDQQTSRKLRADAADRLAIARRRAKKAREKLIRWEAWDFFGERPVAEAVSSGETDPSNLRGLASTDLTDDELRFALGQVEVDRSSLHEWLSTGEISERVRAADYEWREFSHDDMPDLNYQNLAEYIFDVFAEQLAKEDEAKRIEEMRQPSPSGIKIADPAIRLYQSINAASKTKSNMPPDIPFTLFTPPRSDSANLIEARRHDDLLESLARAIQRVEDLEEELTRLGQQHADIVKPDIRLWWGVIILIAYAIAGVAVPLWVMSNGPTNLQNVRWIFWPFAIGLALLIGYITAYMITLTNRRREGHANFAEGEV